MKHIIAPLSLFFGSLISFLPTIIYISIAFAVPSMMYNEFFIPLSIIFGIIFSDLNWDYFFKQVVEDELTEKVHLGRRVDYKAPWFIYFIFISLMLGSPFAIYPAIGPLCDNPILANLYCQLIAIGVIFIAEMIFVEIAVAIKKREVNEIQKKAKLNDRRINVEKILLTILSSLISNIINEAKSDLPEEEKSKLGYKFKEQKLKKIVEINQSILYSIDESTLEKLEQININYQNCYEANFSSIKIEIEKFSVFKTFKEEILKDLSQISSEADKPKPADLHLPKVELEDKQGEEVDKDANLKDKEEVLDDAENSKFAAGR